MANKQVDESEIRERVIDKYRTHRMEHLKTYVHGCLFCTVDKKMDS